MLFGQNFVWIARFRIKCGIPKLTALETAGFAGSSQVLLVHRVVLLGRLCDIFGLFLLLFELLYLLANSFLHSIALNYCHGTSRLVFFSFLHFSCRVVRLWCMAHKITELASFCVEGNWPYLFFTRLTTRSLLRRVHLALRIWQGSHIWVRLIILEKELAFTDTLILGHHCLYFARAT